MTGLQLRLFKVGLYHPRKGIVLLGSDYRKESLCGFDEYGYIWLHAIYRTFDMPSRM